MQLLKLKNELTSLLIPLYGIDEAQHLFYMLAEFYLSCSKIDIALDPLKEIGTEKQEEIEVALKRLLTWEPIQYIIGAAYFYGNDFKVNEATLIPRPETEELIEWVVHDLKEQSKEKSINVLDIGTGSGCIAISLALQLPKAKVSAIDISNEALKIAKENAKSLSAEVDFIEEDILEVNSLSETFDVVVSNPPYVRNLEKEHMRANVLEHEPNTALFVLDTDPLLFYRKIAELFLAKAFISENELRKKRLLYFEINEYLAQELSELLYKIGFVTVEVRKDFRGKDRMLKATL